MTLNNAILIGITFSNHYNGMPTVKPPSTAIF